MVNRLLCGLGLVILATSAQSAVLELVNEDRITGEIISLEEGILEFRSPVMGDLRIPWSKVMRVESESPLRIEFVNGRRLQGDFVIVGEPLVVHPDSPIPMLDKSTILGLGPVSEDDRTEYSGRLNLGGGFYRGNSDEDQFNLDAELVARNLDDRYTLGLLINEGSSKGLKTTSERAVSAQYDVFYSRKDYLFVKAQINQDELEDLNLRASMGAGYGRQLLESRRRNLAIEAGLSAIRENYSLSADRSFPSLGLAVKFDRRLFDGRVKLFNVADYSVNLEEGRDYLLKNRFGFRVPIAQGLNFSTQFSVEYDNLPTLAQRKTDTSLLFSVGLGF